MLQVQCLNLGVFFLRHCCVFTEARPSGSKLQPGWAVTINPDFQTWINRWNTPAVLTQTKITGSKTSPFVLLLQVCHRPAEWWRRWGCGGGGGWRKSSQNQQLPHQVIHSHLWGHRLSHRLQEAATLQEAEPQAEVKVTRSRSWSEALYKVLLSWQIWNCFFPLCLCYCCRCVGLPLHRLKCFLLGCSELFMMCYRCLRFCLPWNL